jgi:hypothetical protein
MDLYKERNRGLSFIVFKHYMCCNPDKKSQSGDEPTPATESVYIISPDLYSALEKVSRKSSQTYLYPNFKVESELSAPYLWFYHDRSFITSTIDRVKSKHRKHLHCLFNDYINVHMGEEYAEVDKQLSTKLISSNFLSYIFVSAHFQSSASHLTAVSSRTKFYLKKTRRKAMHTTELWCRHSGRRK